MSAYEVTYEVTVAMDGHTIEVRLEPHEADDVLEAAFRAGVALASRFPGDQGLWHRARLERVQEQGEAATTEEGDR